LENVADEGFFSKAVGEELVAHKEAEENNTPTNRELRVLNPFIR